jgi:hypothetical protein
MIVPRVCETCKHKSTPPPELMPLAEEMSKYYPKVYYCSRLQVIKCYNPDTKTQLFDCDQYEPVEA